MLLLRRCLFASRSHRLRATSKSVHDGCERIALGDEPARLGRGEARSRCVKRPPGGLTTLLDVRALGFGPRQDELGLLGGEPGGLGAGADLAHVRLGGSGDAFEAGVPLDRSRHLLLGHGLGLEGRLGVGSSGDQCGCFAFGLRGGRVDRLLGAH